MLNMDGNNSSDAKTKAHFNRFREFNSNYRKTFEPSIEMPENVTSVLEYMENPHYQNKQLTRGSYNDYSKTGINEYETNVR
jgi:hypothetical protein